MGIFWILLIPVRIYIVYQYRHVLIILLALHSMTCCITNQFQLLIKSNKASAFLKHRVYSIRSFSSDMSGISTNVVLVFDTHLYLGKSSSLVSEILDHKVAGSNPHRYLTNEMSFELYLNTKQFNGID